MHMSVEDARKVQRPEIDIGATYKFYSTAIDIDVPNPASELPETVLLRNLTGQSVRVLKQIVDYESDEGTEAMFRVVICEGEYAGVEFDAYLMEINGFGYDTGQFAGPSGEWGSVT